MTKWKKENKKAKVSRKQRKKKKQITKLENENAE